MIPSSASYLLLNLPITILNLIILIYLLIRDLSISRAFRAYYRSITVCSAKSWGSLTTVSKYQYSLNPMSICLNLNKYYISILEKTKKR